MVDEFSIILRQPEYLHVILHGFPVYGSVLGAFCLVLALVFRSRPAQLATLALLVVSASIVLPVEHFGEQAEDRIESVTDAPGREWLDTHKERAEKVVPAFVVLAGLALVAMLVPGRFPRTAFWLTLITLLAAFACVGGGAWVARAGGQIRHKEFRTGGPPVAKADGDHHAKHGKREHH